MDTSPIKWRQRPDMTIAVDWDAVKTTTQTNGEQDVFVLIYYYNNRCCKQSFLCLEYF